MSKALGFGKDILSGIREKNYERIAEEVRRVEDEDIFKATAALLEGKVKKEKAKELLIKYWDLRPSEADRFIQAAEENLQN